MGRQLLVTDVTCCIETPFYNCALILIQIFFQGDFDLNHLMRVILI